MLGRLALALPKRDVIDEGKEMFMEEEGRARDGGRQRERSRVGTVLDEWVECVDGWYPASGRYCG